MDSGWCNGEPNDYDGSVEEMDLALNYRETCFVDEQETVLAHFVCKQGSITFHYEKKRNI